MSSTVKFKCTIELELESGPALDAETMLDAFAATIGRQNTATHPLKVESGQWAPDGEFVESVYVVRLVDDA